MAVGAVGVRDLPWVSARLCGCFDTHSWIQFSTYDYLNTFCQSFATSPLSSYIQISFIFLRFVEVTIIRFLPLSSSDQIGRSDMLRQCTIGQLKSPCTKMGWMAWNSMCHNSYGIWKHGTFWFTVWRSIDSCVPDLWLERDRICYIITFVIKHSANTS